MRTGLKLFNGAMAVFMLAPLVIVVLISFTPEEYFALPTTRWSLRWYREVFHYPGFVDAFLLSLRLALLSAFVATGLTFLAVYALVRFELPGRKTLDGFFMSPLLVPAVVFGIAMLQFLNLHGLYNNFWGLAAAHIVIIVPFAARAIMAALHEVPHQLEWAAMSLGAGRLGTIWRITLPLAGRGVLAGFLFAFIISFDEVTTTIFITGPAYQTLPVRVYNYLTDQIDPTIAAVSSMLILMSFGLILVLDRIGGFKSLGR
ncbi:MAG TPA: ABC transporter permease [Alphaproteobacteria bacterium]|nr:ABC transporter permease [Alphaproteobacteria bacterium]